MRYEVFYQMPGEDEGRPWGEYTFFTDAQACCLKSMLVHASGSVPPGVERMVCVVDQTDDGQRTWGVMVEYWLAEGDEHFLGEHFWRVEERDDENL